MNVVVINGRLGKEPEVRKTKNGKSVMSASIAVRNRNSEDPYWIPVVIWDKAADFLGRYAHKGDSITVQGRLTTREAQRDGIKYTALEVTALEVELHNSKGSAPKQPKQADTEYEEFAQQYRDADPEEDLPW